MIWVLDISLELHLQPRFDSSVKSVTVALGEVAVLPCAVYNMGDYEVKMNELNDIYCL